MPRDRWKHLGPEPFWRLVDKSGPDGCWLWLGKHDRNGYGQVSVGRTTTTAHRHAYVLLVGPIPEGLVLDHTCKIRDCVNPAHLDPVTQRENLMRSPTTFQAVNAAKTHCIHGHLFDDANTYRWQRPDGTWKRTCRMCAIERSRAYYQRRQMAAASQGG
jgi:hypothetical protein